MDIINKDLARVTTYDPFKTKPTQSLKKIVPNLDISKSFQTAEKAIEPKLFIGGEYFKRLDPKEVKKRK